MTEQAGRGHDTSGCFGNYRAQSPLYALTYCVKCPKIKPCVRTVWGMETPRRTARREYWWESSPRGRARRDQPPPNNDYAAT